MTIEKVAPTSDYLTEGQVAQLLRAINPKRVGEYKKNDRQTFAHVEAYELRAHLNRILGFGRWSEDVIDQQIVFENGEMRRRRNNKGEEYGDPYMAWTVCYRSIVRLTLCAPSGREIATYTEGATGEATNQTGRGDAHDLALKTSQSQAFKRCCANLGDQFGLSLWKGGSKSALVRQTLLMPDVQAADEGIDSDADGQTPESESYEPPPDPRATSTSPAPAGPPVPAGDPAGAAVEPESPPAAPAAADPDGKSEAQRWAEEIRALAVADKPADFQGSDMRWVTHLMGEAVKKKVHTVPVESLYSPTQVALRALLEERMKQINSGVKAAT